MTGPVCEYCGESMLSKWHGDCPPMNKRVPIKWVPKLEQETSNPVYGKFEDLMNAPKETQMTCEGTKHRFNLSRLADNDAPWLCECGAVEWMEENGNLDCVALDLEKVLRVAQEREIPSEQVVSMTIPDDDPEAAYWRGYIGAIQRYADKVCEQIKPDHLIEPPGEST